MRSVLLIEDDDAARRALRLALSDEGYKVLEAAGGREGLRQMDHHPDLVLLDLVLPDLDGLDVLRTIRAASDVPVVIVSGRSDDRDVVAGLHRGADDYVTKPLSAAVLKARLTALLRRVHTGDEDAEVSVGDLVIRPRQQTVLRRGQEVALTRTEFRLLCELAAHPGEVVTRQQLLLQVWGYDYFGDTRLLDVHVRRLRTKVEDDPASPQLIGTVRGVGYKLRA